MNTIRELISAYQSEVAKGELTPERAATFVTQLSALYGNVNKQILATSLAYNRILKTALETNEAASRAKIQAETTPEYVAKMEAQNAEKELLLLIRSLNRYLKVKEEEYRTAKYQ
jgi:hypothetical protein